MKYRLATAAALIFTLATASANTAPTVDCVDQAAQYHAVNANVLRAILWNESGMRPRAVNKNANGSVDVGIGQINSIHFKRLRSLGVTPELLLDACVGTYVAAWHLQLQIKELGNTWAAIGAYHSRTPIYNQSYANGVARTLASWGIVEKGFYPFPNAPKSSGEAQRMMKKSPPASALASGSHTSARRSSDLIALLSD